MIHFYIILNFELYMFILAMLPVRTELPQKPTQLCSGARRSFFCRMKCGNKSSEIMPNTVKVEKDPDVDHSHKKRKSGKCLYVFFFIQINFFLILYNISYERTILKFLFYLLKPEVLCHFSHS